MEADAEPPCAHWHQAVHGEGAASSHPRGTQGSPRFHESPLTFTEPPNGAANHSSSPPLEAPSLPGRAPFHSPVALGCGLRCQDFAPSGSAGGRAGCRAGMEASRRAHLFPELEQTGSTRGGCQRSVLSEPAKGTGESGLAAAPLGSWLCPEPGGAALPAPPPAGPAAGAAGTWTRAQPPRGKVLRSGEERGEQHRRAARGASAAHLPRGALRGGVRHPTPWGAQDLGGVSTSLLSV